MCVHVAQQDRAQDSYLIGRWEWETAQWIRSNSGNALVFTVPIPSQASGFSKLGEGVETERAIPDGIYAHGKETVQPTNTSHW